MNRFNELMDILKNLESDFTKFYEQDNQAAGTRLRKGMMEMKKLAQDIRVEVQDIKNSKK